MSPTPFDAWQSLREITAARIALGRSGASLPTREVLDFQLAHARARDAVLASLDLERLASNLEGRGFDVLRLTTEAHGRAEFLLRPDRGRMLSDTSRDELAQQVRPKQGFDLVIVVADGLSAPAAESHAPSLIDELLPRFVTDQWRIAPICVVKSGRVAIADQIGSELNARLALILLGERPGLGAADSLGAYFVFDPNPTRTDAERNCVSNIRPQGLPIRQAAETLHYLMTAARTRRLSGIHLKDDRHLTSISERHGSRLDA